MQYTLTGSFGPTKAVVGTFEFIQTGYIGTFTIGSTSTDESIYKRGGNIKLGFLYPGINTGTLPTKYY